MGASVGVAVGDLVGATEGVPVVGAAVVGGINTAVGDATVGALDVGAFVTKGANVGAGEGASVGGG